MNFSNYKIKPLILAIVIINMMIDWILSSLGIEVTWEASIPWVENMLEGVAPTILILGVLSFYNKYLWKYSVCSFLVKAPNLNGTYTGEIAYNYNSRDNIKKCTLEIKQIASKIQISCVFFTDGENTTKSYDVEAFFKFDGMRKFLYYYYTNEGSNRSNDTLNQHNGFAIFEIKKDEKKRHFLDGRYFTNRETQGAIRVYQT